MPKKIKSRTTDKAKSNPKAQSKTKSQSKRLPKPLKSKNLPATFGDLENLRTELKSDNTSVKLEVSSVKHGLVSVKHDLAKMAASVKSLENKMDSRFEEMQATNHRMLALLEEQASKNRFALDGYAVVHEAQLKLEDRVDKIEKNQFDLAKLLKTKNL